MFKFIIIIVFSCFALNFAVSAIVEVTDSNLSIIVASDFEKTFFEEFDKNENKLSSNIDQLIDTAVNRSVSLKLVDLPKAKDGHKCLQCRAATTTFLSYRKLEKSDEFLVDLAVRLCKLLQLAPSGVVCEGMVQLNRPMAAYILAHRSDLLAKQICALAFQHERCYESSDTFEDISVRIDEAASSNDIAGTSNNEAVSADPLTVLHLTDIHYDPHYLIGGNAVCHNGACCKDNQGPPVDGVSAAGWWGDYRDCDTPWHAIVDGVEHIKRQHPKIDLVYFTGDIIDHFVWETTEESNHQAIDKVFTYLKQEFLNTPLYPAIGNHEAHPANLFAPNKSDQFSTETQRLYAQLSDLWIKNEWLPKDTENTVNFGGFYTTLVRPGFRIITLNNNLCYGHNWWILFDNGYMRDQLQWLQNTLHAAEAASEVVHLLAHVPANDPLCYKPWSKAYRQIIERYAGIIKGQFNGHSHFDEFNLYYSQKLGDLPPVHVAWNGGSLTTFSELNPNYRVYEVDNQSLEVLNHETWIYNLTEANQEPWNNPRWYKEYSFKEFFGLPNLKLETLHGLVKGFGSNETRIQDYWRLKVKHADPQLKRGVTLQQLRTHFCDILTVEEGDEAKCDELWRL